MKKLIYALTLVLSLTTYQTIQAQTYGTPLFTEDFGVVPAGQDVNVYRGDIAGRGTIGNDFWLWPATCSGQGWMTLGTPTLETSYAATLPADQQGVTKWSFVQTGVATGAPYTGSNLNNPANTWCLTGATWTGPNPGTCSGTIMRWYQVCSVWKLGYWQRYHLRQLVDCSLWHSTMDDGGYALSANPKYVHGADGTDLAWHTGPDHTGNPRGMMLVVNAAMEPGMFYRRTITGLCYGAQFDFRSYYENILNTSACGGIGLPINIRYEVWSQNPGDDESNALVPLGGSACNGSTLLGQVNTGNVQATTAITWNQTDLIFNVPLNQDSVVIILRNNAPGGCGNDLAIDDISFSPFIPFTIGYTTTTTNYCTTGTIRLTGSVTAGSIPSTIPYVFQWQQAPHGTSNWTNIGSTITNIANAFIDLNVNAIGSYDYRIVSAASVQNFNNSNCYVASAIFVGSTIQIPTGSITSSSPDVCGTVGHAPVNAIFAVNYQGNVFPWTYYYQINGGPVLSQVVNSPNTSNSKTISITNNTTVTLVRISTTGCDVSIGQNLLIIYSIGIPPAPTQIHGPNPACIGTQDFFSVDSIPGATSYTWAVSDGWQIISGQGTRFATLLVGTSAISIQVTAGNACGANTFSAPFQTTNLPPSAPATITTPNGLCLASGAGRTDILFRCSAVAGAQNYIWTWDSTITLGTQIIGSTGQFLQNIILSVPNNITSFHVSVEAQNGCGYSPATQVTFNAFPAVAVSASGSSLVCSGDTIDLTAIPSGGVSPYVFSWSGPGSFNSSQQNPIRTAVVVGMSGNYTVTLTDHQGCTASASTNYVTVNQSPTVAATSNSYVYCSGATINLSGQPTNGVPPYNFAWSGPDGFSDNGQNPTRLNSTTLASGVYSVTLTDNNGCSASASTPGIVVHQSPVVTAGSTSQAYCANTTIQLSSAPSGGKTPYSYSWSGPQSFSGSIQNPSIPDATTDMSGVYTVVVTDSNGCTASNSTGSIIVNPALTLEAYNNSPVCSGGTINLTSSSAGGTLPFGYAWSGPLTYSSTAQNPSLSGAVTTMSGIYSVTITDVNGCSGIASTNVTVNPAASVSVSSNSPVCEGDTINLVATPFGGSAPFTYTWSGPAAFSSSAAAPVLNNGQLINAGTYNVTATDANGCSGTGSGVVNINLTPSITAGSSKPAYCVNNAIALTSSPSGGTLPYSFNWSGPLAYSNQQQNPDILNATTGMTGIYSVTVTDTHGCSASASISVQINSNPLADAGASQTSCSGERVILGGNPTASGGTGPYTFAWNNGASGNPNPEVFPLISTTYVITVTDNNTCTASASSAITVNPKPVADAGADKTIPSCSLVGTGIGGSPAASGGTGPYTYLWSPSAGLSSTTDANPNVTGIGSTTSYTLIVSDANGCTAGDAVVVNVTGSTLGVSIGADGQSAWCASSGSSVTLTANASGGLAPYSYAWLGSHLSSFNTASTIANPDVAGTYVYAVVITDATGCQTGDTTSIIVHAKPSASAGATDYYICRGLSTAIGGNPTATGGTLPYSYAWSGGALPVANPVVSPVSDLTYIVIVTDSNSCSASASTTVVVRPNPIADAGADKILPACSPTGLQIGGNPTGTGGSGPPYTYAWSPSGGLSSVAVPNPTVSSINSDKTYTVIVTDSNGCSATDQVFVHLISNTPAVNITANGSLAWCTGSQGSVNLTANVSGGTTPFSYSWSGAAINPSDAQTTTVTPDIPGLHAYIVTVTDAFNCTATANSSVTVNSNPTANAGSDNYTICNGQNVTIGGNPTANGGTGPYRYSWNNGASPVSNPVVSPGSTISYTVVVTDVNNCTASASSTVTVRTNPVASAGPDVTIPSCTPSGLQIGGSPTASGGGGGPYGYLWSPITGLSSSSSANPTVTGITADKTYTIVVTDVNGCTAADQVIVYVINNTPAINISASGNTSWCSGGNNSVNLTAVVTGGTNPLSYTWSGTNINPVNSQIATVYPNISGTYNYSVTVTDGFNCTATATKTVKVNSVPVVNAGAQVYNVCSGQALTIGGNPTAQGGTSPYLYAWNSGANAVANPVVNPVASTTYIVTVTDSLGCSATAASTVLVRTAIIANAGSDKSVVSCNAACVLLGGSPSGAGGSGPLTYAWSPSTGLNSTTIANPSACALSSNTLYSLTITDSSGCSATDQVMITVIASSLTAKGGTGGQRCAGSGDSVMLGGYPTGRGGTLPYTYTWSPITGLNLTDQANPTALPSVTTKYFLTVTDANGCTATDTAMVRVYPFPVANAGRDTAVCAGSSVVLGGNPTASGGSGSGYSYSWSPTIGLTSTTAANPQASPFTTINYVVTVTDGNGCNAVSSMLITVNPNPEARAGNDKSITICPLDSIFLGDNPAAINGTFPYTYSWSPSLGLNNVHVPNPVLSGISSTQTYILNVTDSNGCKSSDNVVVTVLPNTLQLSLNMNAAICGGANSCVQLGGLPTVIGGTIPYTYAWTNSNTLTNPTSANPTACPVATTTYALTVTDAKGCIISGNQTVKVNVPPVAHAGANTSFCLGNTVYLGGSPSATSGTPPYHYLWSPAIGLSSSTSANPAASPPTVTIYQLQVTDSNGCTSSAQVTVTPRSNPVVDAGADKTLVPCTRDTAFIGGTPVVVSGGTGPFNYHWSPATGLSDSTAQRPFVTGLGSTTSYEIYVTDVFGCAGSDFVIVNVGPSTLQTNAGNAVSICANASVAVPLGGNPTATGGTGPYQFHWSPVNGLSNSTVSNPTALPAVTTTYYLTVTDAKGCNSVDSVKVIVNPLLVAHAGRDTAICADFGIIMGGSPTATGGTPGYQYAWLPRIGLISNNTSNPMVYPTATTVYSVTVTDAGGCQARSSITITVNPEPAANAGADQTLTSCLGDTARLGGSPAASGGTPGYTYQWSPLTGLSSGSTFNPYVTGISSSTIYSLTVTDINGCTGTDAVFVSVASSGLVAEAGNDVSYCSGTGNSKILGGSPTVSGGVAPYIYTWAPSAYLSASNIANPVANPVATTVFYVTVTDAKGCISVDSVKVIVNQAPIAFAGADTASCNGVAVTLGAIRAAAGGVAPYTYLWSPATGLSSTSASNPAAMPGATTTYSLTVTDSKGCTGSDQINVVVHNNPVADAGPDNSLVACSSDSVQIGGSPAASGGVAPYTYNWSPNAGLSGISLPNPFVAHLGSNATFTLLVTDSYGCTSSDQVLISVSGSSLTATAGNNVSFCSGNTTPVTLGGSPTATGGNPSYSYVWFPSGGLSDAHVANPSANPVQTTTYSVVVTDAHGCIAEDTVLVKVNPAIVVNAGLADTVCAGSQVQLGGSPTASGGTGSYHYQWIPSLNLTSATVANPAAVAQATITYTLNVTDSMGCSNSGSVGIMVNQNPVANAGADKTVVTCQLACVTIGGSPSASGGTPSYLYTWSPSAWLNNAGVANPTVCGVKQTILYTLTVTDLNGCTAIDQVLVTGVAANLVADAGPDRSICVGQASCITIGGNPSVSGGTGPYNITWTPTIGICNSNLITNPDVKPLDTTVYTLFVRDVNGCVAIDSMVTRTNPVVTASVSPDTSICAGNSAVLGNSPTASSGTPPFTYAWSSGQGLSSTTIPNPTASPLATTTYCVTVTDAAGCSATACQSINVSPAVTACAGPIGGFNMTTCPRSYVIIGCTPTASGGSGNYSYSWSPGSVNGVQVLNGSTIANPVVSNLTSTTLFTVTVTDNVSGCTATAQVTVNVSQSALTAYAGNSQTLCAGSSSCITIGGNPTAAGAAPPFIYQWSPVTGINNPNIANPCVTPLVNTTYVVTVTDHLGCNAVSSVTITVHPQMTVNAGKDTSVCYGQSVVLGGIPEVSGGVAPYSYSWSPATNLNNSNSATPTAQNLTGNTTYTVLVTDAYQCSASADVMISVMPLPIANAGPDVSIYACGGDSAALGGTPTGTGTVGPYTYSWSPPLNLSLSDTNAANPVIRNLGQTTLFTVAVRDVYGCTAKDQMQVTVLPNTLFVEGGTNIPAICPNSEGCVTLGGNPTVFGGVPPYTYLWNGSVSDAASSNPQACPVVTTTYLIIATDSRGCQASDTVRVVVKQPVPVSISGLDTLYCIGHGNVVMTGIPSGGVFSGAGVTGNIFQPTITGTGTWCITYTYTDGTGCSSQTVTCVKVKNPPVVSISGYAGSYCRYEDPVVLTGSPAGGTFTGSGMNGNVFTPSEVVGAIDTITYTYSEPLSGCSNSTQIFINIKSAPALSVAVSADSVCNGQTVTLTPAYSLDVFNIIWTQLGGSNIGAGLNPQVITPSGVDYCVVAAAVNTPDGCVKRDTVCIHVNQPPVVPEAAAFATCEQEVLRINLLADVTDPENNSNNITILVQPLHGALTNDSGGVYSYKSTGYYYGIDSFMYAVCNMQCSANCDTAEAYISICRINHPPVILDTTIIINENDTAKVCPFIYDFDNDPLVISNGNCGPINGSLVFTSDSCFEFIPNPDWTGTQIICIVVCDTSGACDTGTIRIVVLPLLTVDTIYDTTLINTPLIVCIGKLVHAHGENWTISSVCNPQNGTAVAHDSCFTYTPANGFSGNDTFCLVVCDSSGCRTTQVIITVLNAHIKAVDDCSNDSTYMNTPVNVKVLNNDTIPPADHLLVTVATAPVYCTATVNPDQSITYTPSANFTGYDEFIYEVCAISGSYKFCDTAKVCINIVDTVRCFIPNGFSPNGDGIHDTYVIPCNGQYPKAALRVFNRWGDEVWHSDGAYNNDWDGRNSNGASLPDATYYIIYSYNDGTGRQQATFVIIER